MLKAMIFSLIEDIKVHLWRDLFVNTIGSSKITPRFLRFIVYRLYGIQTQTLDIRPGSYFKRSNVRIGRDTFINYDCLFDNLGNIEIGDKCAIGPQVMFATITHESGGSDRRAGGVIAQPIIIGNGCWIGARAMILPGVNVAEGCIIAAGALVIRDCEPHGLYAGVPAKRIKELDSNAS